MLVFVNSIFLCELFKLLNFALIMWQFLMLLTEIIPAFKDIIEREF